MLDPKWVREHYDIVEKGLKDRGASLDVLREYKEKDDEWRSQLIALDALKAKRNQQIPKGKPSDEERQILQKISAEIKEKQALLNECEAEVKHAALSIPNIPDPSVPIGNDETDNKVLHTVGTPRVIDFEPLSHDVLGKQLNILDMDAAVRISGSRFALYRGWGARLERALITFMLDEQRSNGYEEILPPVIVKTDSLRGTGQLPKFSDDLFKLEDTDYWLSPTAEVQLTNVLSDRVMSADDLPVKLTAYTPCFRREAGSHGKDIKGLIRLHQFNKVELVQCVKDEASDDALMALTSHAESILKKLELPYRAVMLCTGDLGFSACKTIDLEVWFPSQNTYREISSCSNFRDFQSRRAMIRYKEGNDRHIRYTHTLNGSGIAVGRAFAAVVENFQNKQGGITIPDCLRNYLGGESEIPCPTKTSFI